jgi:hypothetical protein
MIVFRGGTLIDGTGAAPPSVRSVSRLRAFAGVLTIPR